MHNTKLYTIFVSLAIGEVFTNTYTEKSMKKSLTVLLVILFTGSSNVFAIGLPNSAYTHKYAPINSSFSNEKATIAEKDVTLLVGQVRDAYADEHTNTLDSPSDLQEFTNAIVNRIVGFVSMILLSLASFGSSLADEIHIAHTWILTDLPPQV